eukprot:Nk52_evm23s2402 gene=Nk52_evmTU23s2402
MVEGNINPKSNGKDPNIPVAKLTRTLPEADYSIAGSNKDLNGKKMIHPDEEEVVEDNGFYLTSTEASTTAASMGSCVFNLCNTIVGVGLLGMGYAFSLAGLLLGIFFLSLFGVGASIGLRMLVDVARWTQRRTVNYFVLSQCTIPSLRYISDAAVVFNCFGIATSALIIIGDNMSAAVAGWLGIDGSLTSGTWADRRIWISVFMCFVGPISVFKQMDKLRFISFIAVVAIIYLVVVVTGYFIFNPNLPSPEVKGHFNYIVWDAKSIIEALPLVVFAYTCHQNVFFVYSEIKRNTVARVSRTIDISSFFSWFIYLLVGTFGYLTFYDNVEGNVLNNLPSSNVFVNACQVLVALLAACSYPLQMLPSIAAIDNLIWGHTKPLMPGTGEEELEERERGEEGEEKFNRQKNGEVKYANEEEITMEGNSKPQKESTKGHSERHVRTRFWVQSLGLMFLSFLIAVFLKDISLAFSLVGSTGSVTISYILPALFYLKMVSLKGETSRFAFKTSMAYVMLVFGVFMLVAGNYVAIVKHV